MDGGDVSNHDRLRVHCYVAVDSDERGDDAKHQTLLTGVDLEGATSGVAKVDEASGICTWGRDSNDDMVRMTCFVLVETWRATP